MLAAQGWRWSASIQPQACAGVLRAGAIAYAEFEHILRGWSGAWCGLQMRLRMNMPACAPCAKGVALSLRRALVS